MHSIAEYIAMRLFYYFQKLYTRRGFLKSIKMEYKNRYILCHFFASITNLMGWHIADILLPARIKQLKEKILIIR